MSMSIIVEHTVSMGHRLPSYNGVCSSPHGHNMRVEVEISVSHGTFLDFKVVASHLKAVTSTMDHAMILHRKDPLRKALLDMGFRVYSMEEEPTTEAIAWEIYREMHHHYPGILRTTVYETDKYSATVKS